MLESRESDELQVIMFQHFEVLEEVAVSFLELVSQWQPCVDLQKIRPSVVPQSHVQVLVIDQDVYSENHQLAVLHQSATRATSVDILVE